jgi:hypothetical protein
VLPVIRLGPMAESRLYKIAHCNQSVSSGAPARRREPPIRGRIFNANAAPVGSPWMWTLIFPHHEGRTPTHGYAESREAAMAAFAKSWRRE